MTDDGLAALIEGLDEIQLRSALRAVVAELDRVGDGDPVGESVRSSVWQAIAEDDGSGIADVLVLRPDE